MWHLLKLTSLSKLKKNTETRRMYGSTIFTKYIFIRFLAKESFSVFFFKILLYFFYLRNIKIVCIKPYTRI